MGHLNAQQKAGNAAATIAILEDPELANPSSNVYKNFMSDIKKHHSEIQSMDRVTSIAGHLKKTNETVRNALALYNQACKDFSAQVAAERIVKFKNGTACEPATHCERCAMAASFNWLKKLMSIDDHQNLVAIGKGSYEIVVRDHAPISPVPACTHLHDAQLEDLGFYVVHPNKSIIFLSETIDPQTGKYHILLVIFILLTPD
ncbi:hypothetical protein FRC03_009706 [Tulasnella sp. 419]|nr:hypothetical protein FRC03_009706 [Tulasnella sp. 419]